MNLTCAPARSPAPRAHTVYSFEHFVRNPVAATEARLSSSNKAVFTQTILFRTTQEREYGVEGCLLLRHALYVLIRVGGSLWVMDRDEYSLRILEGLLRGVESDWVLEAGCGW